MKIPKRSTVKHRLWTLVSRYIRMKDAVDGYCTCVTCGVVKPINNMDAGHFVPRGAGDAVYFVEENIHPQCNTCNRFRGGNLIEYTRFMIDTYGIEKVDELRELAKNSAKNKITIQDLLDLELEYKEKLNSLEH